MSMVEQQLWEEGRDQECEKRDKRGSFYRRGGGSPLGGVRRPNEEFLLLFISLFMMVTPSSICGNPPF
jgi:hypothetical protein